MNKIDKWFDDFRRKNKRNPTVAEMVEAEKKLKKDLGK